MKKTDTDHAARVADLKEIMQEFAYRDTLHRKYYFIGIYQMKIRYLKL